MQPVCGYAVCPSPSQVSTCPTPSMRASAAVFWYGVAGSPVVPTTTIGGAPAAAPVDSGSRLAGHNAHDNMPSADSGPKSGYLFRHWICSVRTWPTVGTDAVSVQFTTSRASNRLEYVPFLVRSAYESASDSTPRGSPCCSDSIASASSGQAVSVYSDAITAYSTQPAVTSRPS